MARSDRSAGIVERYGATAARCDLADLRGEHLAGCDALIPSSTGATSSTSTTPRHPTRQQYLCSETQAEAERRVLSADAPGAQPPRNHSPRTSIGTLESSPVPSPSMPKRLSPKQRTGPSAQSAHA